MKTRIQDNKLEKRSTQYFRQETKFKNLNFPGYVIFKRANNVLSISLYILDEKKFQLDQFWSQTVSFWVKLGQNFTRSSMKSYNFAKGLFCAPQGKSYFFSIPTQNIEFIFKYNESFITHFLPNVPQFFCVNFCVSFLGLTFCNWNILFVCDNLY